ncbi:right-handed parallel beta-helix repeat-containing protein [Sphingomonas ginsenosidivorax]|uniref:Right-handed parallel beta-helix repeat-containing protein n=1 Tax=Sphingomonas ginsenosidivorax TaxID=862135 RepID=A0A5C6UHT9_9SPHN|nr:right-handed parallel beta-helix repeat-containing protein [Sphingomonas ginsenosidivorax]TXC72010.1 right-handed parallel beta-helix repeat-containing protein [Sphingomonas ginsenosidivorax]
MNRRLFLAVGTATAALAATQLLHGQRTVPPERAASKKVSEFGIDGAAMQRAIDSDAREIVIDVLVTILSDVRLRANQTLRFAGGRLRVPANARIKRAVLYGEGITGVAIIDAAIERNGSQGVTGIRLLNVGDTRIKGGRLTRANLALESYDGAVARAITVSGLTVDLSGWRDTAIWISGINGVALRDVECLGGIEGVGIYNGAHAIQLTSVSSHDHVRDGFVIIAGYDVSHNDCRAYDNGQSGFTTQRQTSARDSRDSRWTGCKASSNGFDGFDIRGATSKSWGVDTGFTLADCQAQDNRRCGFYIVMAEGTVLTDCSATGNDAQNLFIDDSDGVVARRFRSVSGAKTVEPGPNKAGILVYNSQSVQLEQPVSRNDQAATQDFGVSLTGRSARGRLTGGSLMGNTVGTVHAAVNTLRVD